MSKIITLLSIVLFSFLFTSCEKVEPGKSRILLKGDEKSLPKELRGMKIYGVRLDNGKLIYVAIKGDTLLSTMSQETSGKNTTDEYVLAP